VAGKGIQDEMKALITLIVIFSLAGAMIASEREAADGEKSAMSPERRKQHHSMTIIDRQWNLARKAMDVGDFETAGMVVEKILEEAVSVENYKPYKNTDKHKLYLEDYNFFRESLLKLKEAVNRKEKTVFDISKSVDEACKRCHSKFR
jgi:cytochrome c556